MQDLRTLAIFVKVAERLSFVRAAADLGITQSGVSNAISRLEEQIGTPLLARTTRKVSLTEHGAAFFERCRQALAEIEEAELVLKNAQLKPSGNLRIDVPVSFGRIKVVPLLGAFQARYPDIALRVTFNDRLVDHIEESIDVSIRFGVLQDSSLIARRLGGAQLSVVGAPRYFAKYGQPKRPEDLAGHNCLAFTFRETRLAREWRFAQSGAQGGREADTKAHSAEASSGTESSSKAGASGKGCSGSVGTGAVQAVQGWVVGNRGTHPERARYALRMPVLPEVAPSAWSGAGI